MFLAVGFQISIWGDKQTDTNLVTDVAVTQQADQLQTVAYVLPQTEEIKPASAAFDPNDPTEVIRAVSAAYGVPAGLLYGIWNIESQGLPGGYGRNWRSARKLAQPGSECEQRYNAVRCASWWRGLKAICNQKRDGKRICDPYAVRTSEAFALGPMQMLPSSIINVKANGKIVWNSTFAADFDGDGVIDPHSLPDAMAMAARHLKFRYDQKKKLSEGKRWIWTASAYFGKQNSGYYEGFKNGNPGVQGYWNQWCKAHGCQGAPAKRAIRT